MPLIGFRAGLATYRRRGKEKTTDAFSSKMYEKKRKERNEKRK
jgi:hypothetical protein